ncbi:CKLF-like MARVEL transmembrane domain-containing protein 3 [Carlito syrichta]|uniref:CKLF-like MARVEL transmembrane domain-containing protein 3 n=1 Tax=Carlito syrichta TaxID=1868482 RepID=A0A1U7SLV8_CARSF|nr:CKLF-like MARVEL transmembrane domain-containing protein 3 [Carlito syrichta]
MDRKSARRRRVSTSSGRDGTDEWQPRRDVGAELICLQQPQCFLWGIRVSHGPPVSSSGPHSRLFSHRCVQTQPRRLDGSACNPAPWEAEGLSFITFICYVASSASAFLTAPLLEFLLALYFLFADAMQLNDKWQGLCWPMMDFLRCVTAALIYFAISITAVAKYSDGASKAAGVFGFFATIVFAIDFYLIFNDVAKFLKQGDSADETTAPKTEEEDSDSDSD